MRDLKFPTIVLFALLSLPAIYVSQVPTPNPNDSLPSLRQIEDKARIGAVRPGARDISRQAGKDRRRIQSEMEPEASVAEEFAEIRKRYDAQLVRVHPDFGCESKHLISVEADCADRILGTSKLSMRGKRFGPDIHYDQGKIAGIGFFSIVMMTELNGVAFEKLGVGAGPLKTLFDFQAPTSFRGAKSVVEAIGDSGITVDTVTFKDKVEPSEGTTFAIRIIGYKTKDVDLPKLHRRDQKAAFNLMRLRADKRIDVTYVVKVVKRSPDGVVHLLWREVGRKPSPVLRFQTDEIPRDFRPEKGG